MDVYTAMLRSTLYAADDVRLLSCSESASSPAIRSLMSSGRRWLDRYWYGLSFSCMFRLGNSSAISLRSTSSAAAV